MAHKPYALLAVVCACGARTESPKDAKAFESATPIVSTPLAPPLAMEDDTALPRDVAEQWSQPSRTRRLPPRCARGAQIFYDDQGPSISCEDLKAVWRTSDYREVGIRTPLDEACQALRRIDASHCFPRLDGGAKKSRVRVTFGETGRVVKVEVSSDAFGDAKCIGNAFAKISVPSYRGAPFTLQLESDNFRPLPAI